MSIEHLLGKIHQGDCLPFMQSLPDKCVDLILTDPPYGINFCSSRTNRKEFIANDGFKEWQKMLPVMLPQFKRILTDTGCCCCCGGGGKTPVTAIFTIEAIKHFNLIQTLVWRKLIGLGWRYRPSYENIIILSKDKDNYNFYDDSKKCSNVIEGINQDIPQYNADKGGEDEHPTQKPIQLMQRLILTHSLKDHIIFEPFAGGGSTLVAAEILGRRWMGCEIKSKYVAIANKRIEAERMHLKFNF